MRLLNKRAQHAAKIEAKEKAVKAFKAKKVGEDDAGTIFPMLASYYHHTGEKELETLTEYFDKLMSGKR